MHELKLPVLGQSVEEATIVTWLKQEGDAIREGDAIYTVQTDKAEIEVESTASGVLRKILVEPGVEVPVLTVVALVGDASEALPADLPKAGATKSAASSTPASTNTTTAPSPTSNAPAVAAVVAASGAAVSPRAKKLAEEHHVLAEGLAGTGPGGRVLSDDVQAYLDQLDATKITPVAKRMAAALALDVRNIQGTGPGGKITKEDIEAASASVAKPVASAPGGTKRVPLSPMRHVIARRMAESKFSAPHYYVTVEVDMFAARSYRASLPYKVSFNDLVLYASMLALKEYPAVNARWAGDAIELVDDINLGMAVALPQGLIVPVVRRAQALSLEALAKQTRALAEKAQAGKLLPDDYSGNTFTISNLGAFGVDQFTAIINQPDAAILAVGQIKDRVVVVEGGIHVRPIMKLTISSDHRIIDGALAAQFMGRLRQILESAAF